MMPMCRIISATNNHQGDKNVCKEREWITITPSSFLLLQEQDSSYTIIKSKETEMVVEGLKPSSVYIFQVKQKIQTA